MHGFCTDFARFQNVQRVLFTAKFDKECRNFKAKNHVISIEKCDKSKHPEIETNLRLALLISGPRVRVPGGAPNFERQIERFGVLFCYVTPKNRGGRKWYEKEDGKGSLSYDDTFIIGLQCSKFTDARCELRRWLHGRL